MSDLHESHEWEEVGACVYCVDCNERLYQGSLPESRRKPCPGGEWDWFSSQGFYGQCTGCGLKDWGEENMPEEVAAVVLHDAVTP